MRLAGQLRLTTFLAGVAGVGALGLGALGVVVATRPAPPPPPPPAPEPIQAPAPTEAVAAPAPEIEAPIASPTGRPVDQVVFGYQGRDLGTDKLKDVTQGQPYKVNVYQDAGKTSANRAKIDLDRDDKWDEKITFEPDKVTRQVASADDEVYDRTFHWDGTGWIPE